MRKIAIAVIVILILSLLSWQVFFTEAPTDINPLPDKNNPPITSPETPLTNIVAENLDTPWSIAFLPDNSFLFTERNGLIKLVDSQGKLKAEPIAKINEAAEIGEGGLLGIAIHPAFTNNNYIYLYYTYRDGSQQILNRLVRMTYKDQKLSGQEILIDKLPGSQNHNGGRIKFGPDGYLYITTGDAGVAEKSQDKNYLGGKILRVKDNGEAAPDNPFNTQVYSYGHRNPQGLTWDSQGRLWATEHGRSGALSGLDELNLIRPGANYGWPDIQGNDSRSGMQTPQIHSGSETWAPSGAAFWNNSIFFGGLRGQALYQAQLDGDKITLNKFLERQFGRIRDVVIGPDNHLYLTTSNKDGRGNPTKNDDRIIKVNIEKLLNN